jgi:hypothetical protein
MALRRVTPTADSAFGAISAPFSRIGSRTENRVRFQESGPVLRFGYRYAILGLLPTLQRSRLHSVVASMIANRELKL